MRHVWQSLPSPGAAALVLAGGGLAALAAAPAAASSKVPLIDTTYLYPPPQNRGHNFDLSPASTLPEVDLRAKLAHTFGRAHRADFLRAVEPEAPATWKTEQLTWPHPAWEMAVWLNVAHRRLVRRTDGTHRVVPAAGARADEGVLPNELRSCRAQVKDNGEFRFELTLEPTHLLICDRGDPKPNEAALGEAGPAWYAPIRP